jgi:hypothetical protein
MTEPALTNRQLNRATLARQLLLDRSDLDVGAAVTHLVGLQAQNPLDPYLALWSRLHDFDPHELGRGVEDRRYVRIVVMRGTIHLVTADDALRLRPVMQPVLDDEIRRHSEHAPLLVGVDLAPVLAWAHPALSASPMSGQQLRAAIAEHFPDLPAAACAYAVRCHLPMVQVPPRGVWGKAKQVVTTPLDTWVGRPLADGDVAQHDDAVRRYLTAFGPATVADATAWCRVTGLREVVERMRPELRMFRDETGRELFDIPEGVRPDPDTPAPVRFLPEYDNVLLSHADRSRFGDATAFTKATFFKGTVLVDGEGRAVYHSVVDKKAKRITLVVEHLKLTKTQRSEVEAEAQRMTRFWHDQMTDHDVRLEPIP